MNFGEVMKPKEFEIKIHYQQFGSGDGVVTYTIYDIIDSYRTRLVKHFDASSPIGIDEAIEKSWELFWEEKVKQGRYDTTKK